LLEAKLGDGTEEAFRADWTLIKEALRGLPESDGFKRDFARYDANGRVGPVELTLLAEDYCGANSE
jgi:hypothetical protein